MSALIANYHEPRQKIRHLAMPDCPVRVLFLEGGENYGKTYLLQCTSDEWKPYAKFVVVELDRRRDVPTPLEILVQISTTLGPKSFPRLQAEVHRVQQRRLEANANGNTISGTNIKIEVLAQESPSDRLITSMLLTAAFVEDLKALSPPIASLIVVFDGYDAQTMTLIDDWFDRSLIRSLAELDFVRLVVCGRQLPTTTVKSRAVPATALEVCLNGVNEEKEWLPVIAALKRRIPGDADADRANFLRGLIFAHGGAPGLIMQRIKMLREE
jgi:hypothetical protein